MHLLTCGIIILTSSPDIIYKRVMVTLYTFYPHLIGGGSVLTTPESAEDVQGAGLLRCTRTATTSSGEMILSIAPLILTKLGQAFQSFKIVNDLVAKQAFCQ